MNITLSIDDRIIKRMDELIQKGVFADRNDAVAFVLGGTLFYEI